MNPTNSHLIGASLIFFSLSAITIYAMIRSTKHERFIGICMILGFVIYLFGIHLLFS